MTDRIDLQWIRQPSQETLGVESLFAEHASISFGTRSANRVSVPVSCVIGTRVDRATPSIEAPEATKSRTAKIACSGPDVLGFDVPNLAARYRGYDAGQ